MAVGVALYTGAGTDCGVYIFGRPTGIGAVGPDDTAGTPDDAPYIRTCGGGPVTTAAVATVVVAAVGVVGTYELPLLIYACCDRSAKDIGGCGTGLANGDTYVVVAVVVDEDMVSWP